MAHNLHYSLEEANVERDPVHGVTYIYIIEISLYLFAIYMQTIIPNLSISGILFLNKTSDFSLALKALTLCIIQFLFWEHCDKCKAH